MPPLEQPLDINGSGVGAASSDKPQRKRRLDVNPSLILSTEGRSKRRRTPSPLPETEPEMDPRDAERAKHLGLALYSKIMGLRDSSGESMAEPFVKLPNKRQFPDYYETIKNPMSLEIIHQKLNAGGYMSLFDVCNDFYQMWNNAKRYNMKESTLFQWAKKMHQITRTFYGSHTVGQDASGESDDGASVPPPSLPAATPVPARTATSVSVSAAPSPSTAGPSTPMGDSILPKLSGPGTGKKRGSYMKDGPTVYKLIKPCMRDIKAAKSSDGQDRDIAAIFLSLPDRRSFPDYYRMIKNPLALDDIETRMMSRRYHTSEEFFIEVERMCDNAMLYNEDESEVWRDAKQIHGIVQHHRALVKERLGQLKMGAPGPKLPPKVMTPVHHSSHPAATVPTAPAIGLPQSMMHAPQAGYVSHASYPNIAYPPQHQQHVPAAAPSSQLPPLPHGVVTEEVVATLDRYPSFEQQAWISSLPPLALNIFRQMKEANDARKRGVPPPTVESRSAPAPDPGPLSPTIKVIDFAYSDAAPDSESTTPVPRDPPSAIRLRNMRGVAAHAVAIASATSELELTAWVADPADAKPEVTLRVNGTAVDTPKLLYSAKDSNEKDGKDEVPAGMRWTVPVSPARLEFKIEVVATKPGAGPETSAIFINRQF
ncbi:hypothetical protein CcaverHIS002_0206230 [Cutaneotrichosporon cavernicola]|uniref:Bromo domain-containing protein n=1 Tax=Cutaneotrichosporon cavernicola TaxID=279322 RepID=A0AA48L1N7_9TREE|nr:uncharacterized protein CcaverHIS019_0206190 [Cutaneotrichosporon cavernicola]BEI81463.1 hypothetical protein CcaverHIS002_0206230 [Cutaneotrichosporon cavernicola]BEI89257.1 hypothetical protein CcaverHIS019_0206190 [Cutaneotrichosporon cavernicola]BEI97033.1 hypothetical protein CcaverHIS631_0206220 [Cutaneotrichosporon cavernicola]BEJ04807.1 hypothetical protein CcaverHIS641_0206240 [Cutaneotrichosporon cavernicola]